MTLVSNRATFTTGKEFTPGRYQLPSETDAVSLVAAIVPSGAAEMIHSVGADVIALLPREEGTGNATGYVNELEQMHVTLFHTSHPDALAPGAKARHPQDIAQLRELARRFKPFQASPVRVILTSSGAVVMVYECLPATPEQLASCDVVDGGEVVNEHAEFSVDHIRRVAKETFEHMPKSKGTRTIIHSTLARVLSPDVSDETLALLRAKCDAISAQFVKEPKPFLISELWYVEETHHFSAQGARTVIPLGNRAQRQRF